MSMEKFKSILNDIAKGNEGPNFWLMFDLREGNGIHLPRRVQIAKELYPECSEVAIDIKAVTYKDIESIFNKRFSSGKDSRKILNQIMMSTSDVGNEYYQLDVEENYHPTPAIHWNFWFLIVNRYNKKVIGISCSACD